MNGLLKILTCGSVDDGKSTLIGHLLYDAKLLFADQEDALALESKATGKEGELDYSLLLDGLIAEREQGITIDVAYRYFQTERRSFIVADSPGHEEYTRNMAVGASFADLAVLLVDASRGIRTQTRRHLRICRLMGIRHFVFAVNKMDLVGYREDAFRAIEEELLALPGAKDAESLTVIPVSATAGDNITSPSEKISWYDGPTLLSYLEEIPVEAPAEEGFILPVQRVCRPDATYRGYEGTISCGSVATGDIVTVLPQQLESQVSGLLRAGEEAEEAAAGDAVSLSLADEIDISRGSVLARGTTIRPADKFQAMILWMDEEPLTEGKRYTLKLATQTKTASVMRIKYIEDIDTAGKLAGRTLEKNGLACVDIACAGELLCDAFDRHRELGRFLLIDKVTHRTAACGTILFTLRRAHNLSYQDFSMTRSHRSEALGQKPMTLWFTGLSGSGKSTLANAMEQQLTSEGFHTMILDGDNVRLGLNRDLGFEKRDRIENIRRVAEVAKLMNDAGLVVLVSFISPFAEDRRRAREIIGGDNFLEVYVSTPLAECERRDIKGLYKKARADEIPNFTGINSPYEAPESPEAEIDTTGRSIEDCAKELMNTLRRNWER